MRFTFPEIPPTLGGALVFLAICVAFGLYFGFCVEAPAR